MPRRALFAARGLLAGLVLVLTLAGCGAAPATSAPAALAATGGDGASAPTTMPATATPRPAAATATAPAPTATATTGASIPPPAAPPVAREAATVVRVIDGDTIQVRLADGRTDTVRYIGIDTPETVDPRTTVECFGAAATTKNTELVGGRAIQLEKDISERDKYDRLLRYVWVVGDDGATRSANEELVKWGFAAASSYPPDVRYQETFRGLQQAAQGQRLGLWGACRSAHDPLPTATALPPTTVPPTAVPPTPTPRAVAPPPTATAAPAKSAAPAGGFDPSRYIGQGNRYNCPDFASQAQAQAVLRADPRDPNGLDADNDGIACEGNRAPRDLVPVPHK
jgi:micrococcal nuclease